MKRILTLTLILALVIPVYAIRKSGPTTEFGDISVDQLTISGTLSQGTGADASGSEATALVGGDASGDESIAMVGTANANYAIAIGLSTASGTRSLAIGYGNTASNQYCQAYGRSQTITGDTAGGFGYYNNNSATRAYVVGVGLSNTSYQSTVVGSYNLSSIGTTTSWVATDPVFTVGNGATSGTRSNAMTVLKNGNVGIGLTEPTTTLEVSGTIAYTPPAVATLVTANVITVNAAIIYVQGDSQEITLGSTPTLPAGTDGQRVTLVGYHGTNGIILQDEGNLAGSNLQLNGGNDVTLRQYDTLKLQYSEPLTTWIALGPVSDN